MFAWLAFILMVLGLAMRTAWVYVHRLTHPRCNPNPLPLAGAPAPQEVWLETADGLRVRAWYYPPKNDGQVNGATIIAIGGPGGALGQSLPPVAF